MRAACLTACLLLVAACSRPEAVADSEPTPQVQRKFIPLSYTAAPARVSRSGYSFQKPPRKQAVASAYSRRLNCIYLERTTDWQTRSLVEAMQHDLGLSFSGFLYE